MLFITVIVILFAVIALGLVGYLCVRVFLNSKRHVQVLFIVPVLIFIGWWLPSGDVHGTWRIQYGLSVTSGSSRGAPSQIQFFECGAGTRMDVYGNKADFAWNITECEMLELCSSIENYKVRVYGFGTRMRLETNGHYTTRNFTATYRKSFFN